MCGLTGFYSVKGERSRTELRVIGKNMAECITHRGPDSHGLWQDPDAPLLLAHRRLSIIDLSDEGAQPMASSSERYHIIYNGEIYNYLDLKADLEAKKITFRGHSDTEILLAAIETWGLNQTLQKIRGMFAIVLWDRKTRELHFARDHLGKKPLYIGWAGNDLSFASELKSLKAHPDFKAQLNKSALGGFIDTGYVQAPYSIYEGVWSLPPGHRLSLKLDTLKPAHNIAADMKAFWNPVELAKNSSQNRRDKKDTEIVAEFEDLLTLCVSDRLISDVPLGAFLSGGIDSSTIVALMQKTLSQPVKTYSIGFDETGFDEAGYAAKIANHLGTDHHEMYVSSDDALNTIPLLPDMYDEPFSDISAIPTYLVSKFARQDVTVALSGDGGDELLGGYSRHIEGPKIWNKMKLMPRVMRSGLSSVIQRVPVNHLDSLNRKHPQFGSKVHKAASILNLDTQEDIYRRLTCRWQTQPILGQGEARSLGNLDGTNLSFAEKMMLWDTLTYLPGDILTKVDRASMAVSLEARAPLLDKRLFEYVWSLPENVKIRGGKGKWLLRQVLTRHVPENLFERPKQGFNIPVGEWLRGPLKDWAEDLLDEKFLKDQNLLDVEHIRSTWQGHLDGQGNHAGGLWNILMFQAWYKRWM